MKRLYILLMLFYVFSLQNAFSKDLESLRKEFVLADIETKVEILNEALEYDNMTALMAEAFTFVIQNKDIIGTDESLSNMALIGIDYASSFQDKELYPFIHTIFYSYDDFFVQKSAMDFLYKTNKDAFLDDLDDFFAKQSLVMIEGKEGNVSLLLAVIDLLESNDELSFEKVFSLYAASRNRELSYRLKTYFQNSNKSYFDVLEQMIISGSFDKKYAALSLVLEDEKISLEKKINLAEKALSISIYIKESDRDLLAYVRKIRQLATVVINENSFKHAAPWVVEYFYIASQEFHDGEISEDDFITIIDCLGKMETVSASVALSVYLGSLNSNAEIEQDYNENVLLATINALGMLGDKASFDYLLCVGYSSVYSENVILASRDALSRLRW